MKKIIFSLFLFAAVGYLYLQYQQVLLKEVSPFLTSTLNTPQPSPSTQTPMPHNSRQMTKCITADGRVLYGMVPNDTHCERIEPVQGNFSILPSQIQPAQDISPDRQATPSVPELKLDNLSELQESLSKLRETLNQRKPVPDDL